MPYTPPNAAEKATIESFFVAQGVPAGHAAACWAAINSAGYGVGDLVADTPSGVVGASPTVRYRLEGMPRAYLCACQVGSSGWYVWIEEVSDAAVVSRISLGFSPGAGDFDADRWPVSSGGGGGGTPGGSSGQLQYNNAGAFAGASGVEISGGHLKLVSGADPSPPSGGVLLYAKSIAGRHLPKIVGPAGIDTVLQVGLHGNSVFMVAPASGTNAPTVIGGTLTTAATMSSPQTIASANAWQATMRKRFQTAATAASVSGMRTAYVQWFRSDAAGYGGFFFRAQLGQNINLNGAQSFVGLCASTAALATTAGAVSALLNMCGMGYDTTDASTGNWYFLRNDGTGTATKVDLGTGAARNTTHGYDLVMFCAPNGAELYVRITNVQTGAVVLDTSYTTDLPAVNVGLAFKAEVNNGAVAAATNIEVAKVYIESDY